MAHAVTDIKIKPNFKYLGFVISRTFRTLYIKSENLKTLYYFNVRGVVVSRHERNKRWIKIEEAIP